MKNRGVKTVFIHQIAICYLAIFFSLGISFPLMSQNYNEIQRYLFQQRIVNKKNNIIRCLSFSPKDHSIWYSDRKGISMAKSHEREPELIIKRSGSTPSNLFIDEDDNIYYSLDDSLVITNKNDALQGEIPFFKASVSRSGQRDLGEDAYITKIIYQKERNCLWVGTSKYGLFKFKKAGGKWSLESENYYSKSKRKDREDKFAKLPSDKIDNIFIDQWQSVWVCTDMGTKVFFGNIWIDINVPNAYVITAFEKINQEVWISFKHNLNPKNRLGKVTFTGDVSSEFYRKFKKNLQFPLEETGVGIRNVGVGRISHLKISKNKDIWLASSNLTRVKGIVNQKIIAENIDTTIFSKNQNLPAERITGLQIDNDNYLWIATDGWGLFTIKLGVKIKFIDTKAVVCHGEKNARFTVVAADGKPPYSLSWQQASGNHAQVRKVQKDTFIFENIGVDTFYFNLTDSLKKDTVKRMYIVTQPDTLTGIIKITKGPDYPDDDRGSGKVIIQGGQFNLENNRKEEGYKVIWNWSKGGNGQEKVDTLPLRREQKNLYPYYEINSIGIGKYTVIIIDTVGCIAEIEGELLEAGHGMKELGGGYPLKKGSEFVIRDKKGNSQLFKKDSAVLIENPNSALDEVVDYLINHQKVVIKLHGHTGKIHNRKRATELSKARANTVRDYLINKGIKDKQILRQVVAHGDKQSLPESVKGGIYQNYRVEIEIINLY